MLYPHSGQRSAKSLGTLPPEKDFPAFFAPFCSIDARLSALFAGQWGRSHYHRVHVFFYIFEILLFAHLILGSTVFIGAFDPNHLALWNIIEGTTSSVMCPIDYRSSRCDAHNNGTDHNQFFPALFHIEVSKKILLYGISSSTRIGYDLATTSQLGYDIRSFD